MGTLKWLLKTVMVTTVIVGIPSVADASRASNAVRIAHAKELLGGANYKKSNARKAESVTDISDFIERMTKEWLPRTHTKKARSLATAIVRESDKYGFDPVFIMAVIQNESGFNPEMRGSHTEIGLMQIKPATAKWIAKKMGIKYKNDKSLLNPVDNVRIGIAFMSVLRDQFDSQSRLYISAYNMGAKRVRQIVAEDKMPKDYVQAVMKRYVAIYSAFAHSDEEEQDLDTLTKNALSKVREITRSVASS